MHFLQTQMRKFFFVCGAGQRRQSTVEASLAWRVLSPGVCRAVRVGGQENSGTPRHCSAKEVNFHNVK